MIMLLLQFIQEEIPHEPLIFIGRCKTINSYNFRYQKSVIYVMIEL